MLNHSFGPRQLKETAWGRLPQTASGTSLICHRWRSGSCALAWWSFIETCVFCPPVPSPLLLSLSMLDHTQCDWQSYMLQQLLFPYLCLKHAQVLFHFCSRCVWPWYKDGQCSSELVKKRLSIWSRVELVLRKDKMSLVHNIQHVYLKYVTHFRCSMPPQLPNYDGKVLKQCPKWWSL